jgi:hypothetical protein
MQEQLVDVGPERLAPSDISPATVAARAPDIGYVEIDGEGVCYDADADEMHLLSPVAGLIWSCLDGQSSLEEISTDLAEAFSQDPSTVRNSVFMALVDFAEKGLVTEPADGDTDEDDQRPATTPRLLTDPPST